MSRSDSSGRRAAQASAVAVVAGMMAAAPAHATGFGGADTDSYMAGDFHNHTTCTDGSTSLETLIKASVNDFDLDWLGQAGHGGTGTRDCRYDDPRTTFGASDTSGSQVNGDEVFWDVSLPDPNFPQYANIQKPAATFLGDRANNSAGHRPMWRWQMLREYVYPEIARMSKQLKNPMLYVGLETNVPGHEHTSMTVLGSGATAQQPWNWGWKKKPFGTGDAIAEFEFRFDRGDNDFSGPNGTPSNTPGVPGTPGDWVGKVANASGTGSGTANHINKAVPSVAWLQANHPLTSYYVPAHLERAGKFNPNGNNGFNIEHLRDFNNAGPTVAVGFETMPGHQASNTRGEYEIGRGTVGTTTYGGTGIYGALIGGVWDGMLGEGRNWFFYASSDWHNRGRFAPSERKTTFDFFPGEYQKLYIPRPVKGSFWHRLYSLRPEYIVAAVRAGNSYSVAGDLIGSDLKFTAEIEGRKDKHHWGWWDRAWRKEAKMGETLVVPKGANVRITLTVTDPKGANNSPYSFPNPSLKQIASGNKPVPPLNKPVLDHVDFIAGNVTGVISPSDAAYSRPATATDAHIYNPTAKVIRTFGGTGYGNKWTAWGEKRTMTFVIRNVQNSMYVRVRGTNLPAGTPNETDAMGNPTSDWDFENPSFQATQAIPCTDPACPDHMFVFNGQKISSYDVAAWADLWFYTNPIFIRVQGEPKLRVEKAHECAEALEKNPKSKCAADIVSSN